MKNLKKLTEQLIKAEEKRAVIQSKVREKNKDINKEIMSRDIPEKRAMELIESATKNELDLGLIEIDIEISDLENKMKEEFFKVVNNLDQVTKEELNLINTLKNVKHFNADQEIVRLAKKLGQIM